jgi:elongation factor P
MLSYTDLKKGVVFLLDGEPYEVCDASFSRMQQRKAVLQARIRSLRTGKLFDRTFQASDAFEEADVEKRTLMFLYSHKEEYIFNDPKNTRIRYTLNEELIGDRKKWLKPNTEITAVFFEEKMLTFMLPIKMDLKVKEAPPGIQGDRSSGGTKSVTLETGAIIQVPLFINTNDIVRVNTETGDYAERVEKA